MDPVVHRTRSSPWAAGPRASLCVQEADPGQAVLWVPDCLSPRVMLGVVSPWTLTDALQSRELRLLSLAQEGRHMQEGGWGEHDFHGVCANIPGQSPSLQRRQAGPGPRGSHRGVSLTAPIPAGYRTVPFVLQDTDGLGRWAPGAFCRVGVRSRVWLSHALLPCSPGPPACTTSPRPSCGPPYCPIPGQFQFLGSLPLRGVGAARPWSVCTQ